MFAKAETSCHPCAPLLWGRQLYEFGPEDPACEGFVCPLEIVCYRRCLLVGQAEEPQSSPVAPLLMLLLMLRSAVQHIFVDPLAF